MKRSGFKRKIGKPMKRRKLRKHGKSEISKVQKELWELCKQIIRLQYGNTCYTSGKTGLQGSNWHTGHMWPKASLGAYLKYDLRILRPQSYDENINRGGNGAVFYAKMLKIHGKAYMNRLEKDRQVEVNALEHYKKLIPVYKEILERLWQEQDEKMYNGSGYGR